jgi:RNA polymerase primary sigma factor
VKSKSPSASKTACAHDQAISACPTTIAEILDMADKVAREEMRIDELIDGLIDPNARSRKSLARPHRNLRPMKSDDEDEEAEDGSAADECIADPAQGRRARALREHRAFYTKMQSTLDKKGSQDKTYLKLQKQLSDELMNIRFTAKHDRALCDSVRGMVEVGAQARTQDPELCVDKGNMPRSHFIKVFPGNEVNIDWLKGEITGQALRRAAAACRAGHHRGAAS